MCELRSRFYVSEDSPQRHGYLHFLSVVTYATQSPAPVLKALCRAPSFIKAPSLSEAGTEFADSDNDNALSDESQQHFKSL